MRVIACATARRSLDRTSAAIFATVLGTLSATTSAFRRAACRYLRLLAQLFGSRHAAAFCVWIRSKISLAARGILLPGP